MSVQARPGSASVSGLGLLREVQVAPSILSADFGRRREQVGEVLDAGARMIHVDVMDGHFVPPITIGPLVVSAIAEQVAAAGGLLDVHLMIERPERHVAEFAGALQGPSGAGVGSVTFHAEATPHAAYTAGLLREAGVGVGVAINPGTGVDALAELDGAIDLALCMTVNPGWGGQAFIERSLQKLPRLREALPSGAAIEVDGGIDTGTAPRCLAAGASLFVAGSAIFGAPSPGDAYAGIVRAVADAPRR
jgi:ribulose-phosphate 3-epimerase